MTMSIKAKIFSILYHEQNENKEMTEQLQSLLGALEHGIITA